MLELTGTVRTVNITKHYCNNEQDWEDQLRRSMCGSARLGLSRFTVGLQVLKVLV